MRTIAATRYVTPLREGGSLPAVVEADDDGMYVMKFRGAGQGAKALVAEVIAGEIARLLGLPIPEIVLLELDPDLARTEPDPEIQDLIRASDGLNVGLDYLPGAINFDPLVEQPDAMLASSIVWFDAFTSNVDRTARNTNLLMWHRKLHLIDHGAALYFHHDWDSASKAAASPFTRIADHVLLPLATQLREADAALSARIDDDDIERIVALVPDAWLAGEAMFADVATHRRAYVEHFRARLRLREAFLGEALRAHGHL
ncbi:MAG: aminotransferase class I and II [Luteimonas sp.]|nr:aminotransferase class I and II [Luteimonas sp.]